MKQILSRLSRIANILDAKGFDAEATQITDVMKITIAQIRAHTIRTAQEDYDEYNDSDRMPELEGIDDYNRFEEREVFNDDEGPYPHDEDDDEYPYEEYEDPDLGVSDDNWALGTLDVEI